MLLPDEDAECARTVVLGQDIPCQKRGVAARFSSCPNQEYQGSCYWKGAGGEPGSRRSKFRPNSGPAGSLRCAKRSWIGSEPALGCPAFTSAQGSEGGERPLRSGL